LVLVDDEMQLGDCCSTTAQEQWSDFRQLKTRGLNFASPSMDTQIRFSWTLRFLTANITNVHYASFAVPCCGARHLTRLLWQTLIAIKPIFKHTAILTTAAR
jgi:hypothetical protein